MLSITIKSSKSDKSLEVFLYSALHCCKLHKSQQPIPISAALITEASKVRQDNMHGCSQLMTNLYTALTLTEFDPNIHGMLWHIYCLIYHISHPNGFLTVPMYHMLHSSQDSFGGSDVQSQACMPVPRKHGKLSVDERLERVCFGFGP